LRFLRPEWLGVLALTLPVIVLFLVRRRRARVKVSSLILWQRVLAAEARRPWLGRLREPLSLLLNLLPIALLAAAAAGPERVVAGPEPVAWAIVLDGDVAMTAGTGDGDSRFDRARRRVRGILERASPLDRVALVLAGPAPLLLAPPGSPSDGLLRALDEATPTEGAADLEASLARAREATGGAPDRLILVGTRDPGGDDVAFVGVGEPAPNAGIVEVRARRDPSSLLTEISVRVENAGPGATVRHVRLAGPAGWTDARELSLGPGKNGEASFLFAPGAEGLAVLRLDPPDGFPRDDRVVVPVAPAPRPRLLSGKALDPFLEAALRAQEDRVDRQGSTILPDGDLPAAVPPDAILMLVGRDPPPELEGHVWVLRAPGGEERESPAVTGWDPSHPLLAGLDLGNLGFRRARPVPELPGRVAIVRAEGGAVVTAEETDRRRVLRFHFALEDTNLPVLAAFPLLVRNVLAWFTREEERWFPAALREGEALEPLRRLPRDVESVFLAGPALPKPIGLPVVDGRISHRPDLRPGEDRVLLVRAGRIRERVGVNRIAPEAAGLPADESRFDPDELPDRSSLREPERDLTGPVLLAALVLLLLEWGYARLPRRV
jgi:hypothetical protein